MAAEIGRYIAENGGVLICGGLGGVMEGAARGAKEAGGVTIGVLPNETRDEANEYIDHVIATGLGDARNMIVVRSADAVIALPGKYGTLTEMAFALLAEIPVVSVSAWKLGEEVEQFDDPVKAAAAAMKLATAKKA
jgi:uncharacterized protein (TIGR00725 family)